MSKNCVIFDLDGTLIDTVPDIMALVNGLLAENKHPPLPVEKGKFLLGLGSHFLIEQMCRLAGIDADKDEIERLFTRWLEIYSNAPMDKTAPFDGVCDTLTALKKAGKKLAVCTNKPHAPAMYIIDKLNLRPYFDVILDADSLPFRKPDPRPLLEAIRLMDGDVAESVMVGDSEPDAKAAENAKIPLILMTYGYALQPFETIPAAALADDFKQIPSLLDTL